MRGRGKATLLRTAVALLLVTHGAALAHAQTLPAESPPVEVDPKREQARAHFQRGVELFEEEAWDAALAEFLRSRELYPTRAATKNAAVCFRKLRRYDEALDAYEQLLARFADLPAEDRATAQRAVRDLARLVGTLEIRAAAPGAVVVVDARERGKTPLPGPLRVSVGTRTVRIYKEGFGAYETRVDVAGGQNTVVRAELAGLARAGRLRVVETDGRTLDVLVDNVVVGKTPWEGTVAAGEHTVQLRGEGDLGAPPASAPVELDETTRLTLRAEALDSALRVEPRPVSARVAIDGVSVGRGVWEGRLRAGTHRIEVAEEGFVAAARAVALDRGEREVAAIELGRDPSSPLWRAAHPPKIAVELDVALAMSPSFGGDVAGGCEGACSRSFGVGLLGNLNVGYQFPVGIGVGLHGGYLIAAQSTRDRAESLRPVGLEQHPGTANDVLRLSGPFVGAAASFHRGERFAFLGRLGLGVAFLSMRDGRTGNFLAPSRELPTGEIRDEDGYAIGGGDPPRAAPLVEEQPASYLHIAPEVRIAHRLGDHVEASLGLGVMLMFALSKPTWQNETRVLVPSDGSDGEAGFGSSADPQDLAGSVIVLILPSLGVRYDFTP
jgi:hypothetical protein